MNKRWLIAVGACANLLAATFAQAEVKVQTVDYKIGNNEFEGYLAYDASKQGKLPGVVIFPAWTGISDNERDHAKRLAELGYVAFVADINGKGIHPKPPKEAGAEASKYMKDRNLYRQHARAGLEQLAKVDQSMPVELRPSVIASGALVHWSWRGVGRTSRQWSYFMPI